MNPYTEPDEEEEEKAKEEEKKKDEDYVCCLSSCFCNELVIMNLFHLFISFV